MKILLDAGASASALNTHDMTPVDEALIREYQDIVDIINSKNAPSKADDELDDVPDDAEDAGQDGDMPLD